MGYAIAAAAAQLGHRVLLVSGPTSLDVPDKVDFLPVESATEMFDAVRRHIPSTNIAIFSAAVADYRPARPAAGKIKKSSDTLSLDLVRNPDILGSCRSEFGFTGTLVGFAAETGNLEQHARAKLTRKSCDLVVANDVSRPEIGFDSADNEVLLVFPDRTDPIPMMPKEHLAGHIINAAIKLHDAQGREASPGPPAG